MRATQMGMILGTAAYIAPEQAKGKTVDRRADIWAFGVVLFEMLTGGQLFTGDTVAEIMASALKEEPKLDHLPVSTPPAIRRLIERCLNKDPKQRLQAIGEARIVLSGPIEEAASVSTPTPSRSRHAVGAWASAAILGIAAAALAFVHFRETPPPEQTVRSLIALPENSTLHSFAISPDGRALVIAAAVNGKPQLWLRAMDALQAQPMASTEHATYPFWSPDSRTIGFFAESKLKKVAASGGPAQSLCDVSGALDGSWNGDDVIVFGSSNAGRWLSIQRVAAGGGVPVEMTKTNGNMRPVFLPDGRHFLSVVGTAEQKGIYVNSLDRKENRRVLPDVSGVMFAPPAHGGRTGHILFVRENTLMAAPFDAAKAQFSGDVFPVAVGVPSPDGSTYLPATVSESGVLLYQARVANQAANQLGWFDRSGKSLGPVGAPGSVFEPGISPDEKSVVFWRRSGAGSDLWVRDLSRGTETRFTSNASSNTSPVWSSLGDRIVFSSNRTGVYSLYQKAASGSGPDELLLASSLSLGTYQWSRDGRFIVYNELDPKTRFDLWVLPIEGAAAERKPIPFLRTEFNELFGQLSPDSHWMAFTSDRSGVREVYVRPFPPGDGEWTISIAGGEQPRWRGDGKELFFEAADGKMMAVPVKAATGTKPSFEAGTPVALFDAHMAPSVNHNLLQYDVTADGKRFLINTMNASEAASPPLTVVTNWNAGLKK